jgi:hypothetical protein
MPALLCPSPRPLTTDRSDTPAGIEPRRVSLSPRTVFSIRSEATRAARCGGESAERGSLSSSSRPVALGQLEHEAPGMLDQAPAGLEELLLETFSGASQAILFRGCRSFRSCCSVVVASLITSNPQEARTEASQWDTPRPDANS